VAVASGEQETAMKKLILLLLVIPLIIVLVARNPQDAGRLFEVTITAGAKLLNAVATAIGAMIHS
jgi:hypothetical protein